MKIMFNHSIFQNQKYGGISRYFVNLVESLSKDERIKPFIVCPIYKNIYLNNVSLNFKKGLFLGKKFPFTGKLIKLINNIGSNKYYNELKPDIYHQTYYEIVNSKIKCPKFITVYDLYHEIFSRDPNFRPKKNSLDKADHIMCISNSTKKDLINLYSINSEKITVAHLGCDHVKINLKNSENFAPFLLFVGSRKQYKNFDFFLKSISLSRKILNDFEIIFYGGGKFEKEEIKLINELKLPFQKIRNLQGDDDQLYKLYNKASALVFPSAHEGFGLPIIEAMNSQCPVICSNIPVFKEVAGDAAEFFDLKEPRNLLDAIQKVVYSESKRKELINSGNKRIGLFSWNKCADTTMSAYKKFV